jgi:uncharacterized membrane protein
MSYPNPPGQPPAYPPAPGYNPAPAHLRGRRPLQVAIPLLVAGLVLVIIGIVVVATKSLGKVNDFQRVDVSAATGTVTFKDAGNYVAYYEADDVDSNIRSVPAVRIALQSPSGKVQQLTTPYGGRSDGKIKIITYDYGGHKGVALYQFKITETGTYEVALEAPPGTASGADIAFGKSIAAGTVAGGLLVVLGILLLIAGIVLLIVGLVKRSRHKRDLREGAYASPFFGGPPPGGPGGPPPGGWQAPQQQPPPGGWPPAQQPPGGWQQPPPGGWQQPPQQQPPPGGWPPPQEQPPGGWQQPPQQPPHES